MPATNRHDPYRNFNFVVDMGAAQAGFAECTGLGAETDVIEYREGNEPAAVRKLPGLTRYSNITLSRGVTDSQDLWLWYKSVLEGQVERRDVVIILLNESRSPAVRWKVRQAWPCRMSGPQLNARGNDVAIEQLEICHEGLSIEQP